jgi:hypothetical protein
LALPYGINSGIKLKKFGKNTCKMGWVLLEWFSMGLFP